MTPNPCTEDKMDRDKKKCCCESHSARRAAARDAAAQPGRTPVLRQNGTRIETAGWISCKRTPTKPDDGGPAWPTGVENPAQTHGRPCKNNGLSSRHLLSNSARSVWHCAAPPISPAEADVALNPHSIFVLEWTWPTGIQNVRKLQLRIR